MKNQVLIFNNDILITDPDVIEPIEYAVLSYLAFWNLSHQKILIKIELNSQTLAGFDPNGVAGTINLGNNQFLIGFNGEFKGQLNELFLTIAHEIVHVKQYVCGELENYILLEDDEVVGFETLWMGNDITNKDYEEQEHEIEAYEYQYPMAEALVQELQFLYESL